MQSFHDADGGRAPRHRAVWMSIVAVAAAVVVPLAWEDDGTSVDVSVRVDVPDIEPALLGPEGPGCVPDLYLTRVSRPADRGLVAVGSGV